jgi:hypothetical protein
MKKFVYALIALALVLSFAPMKPVEAVTTPNAYFTVSSAIITGGSTISETPVTASPTTNGTSPITYYPAPTMTVKGTLHYRCGTPTVTTISRIAIGPNHYPASVGQVMGQKIFYYLHIINNPTTCAATDKWKTKSFYATFNMWVLAKPGKYTAYFPVPNTLMTYYNSKTYSWPITVK